MVHFESELQQMGSVLNVELDARDLAEECTQRHSQCATPSARLEHTHALRIRVIGLCPDRNTLSER